MKLHRNLQARQSLDHARAAVAAGRLDAALDHLGRALAANPGLLQARLLAARVHLDRNQPTRALDSLDRHDFYAPQQRDWPDVAMLRAAALVRSGQLVLAQPLLASLATRLPDDTRPQEMLVGIAVASGDDALAVTHLRQLLRLVPDHAENRRLLAEILAKTDVNAAIDLLEATPRPQKDRELRLRLAALYEAADRDAMAEEIYAALLKPGDPSLNPVVATEDEEEIDPRNEPQVWVKAGEIADRAGADQLALARLRQAAKLQRTDETAATAAIAMAHLHAGRFAIAGRNFWQITRRQPSEALGWAGLLTCAGLEERNDLAAHADEMLRANTDPAERQLLLAELWIHASAGRALQQASDAQAAPSANTHSPLRDLLRRSSAKLQAQIAQTPGRADMHFHLAQCRAAEGDVAAAATAVARAIEINPNYAAANGLQTELQRAA